MNTDDMTPEQKKAFMEMAAAVTKLAEGIIIILTDALKPITDFYASLPEEIKRDIAAQHAKEQINAGSNNRD